MAESYRSILRGVRISPRKARLVIDLVRGKHVQDALDVLRFTNRRAAPVVSKMISSTMSNAQSVATVDVDRLVVQEAFVDEGPTIKRFLPRAQGRATPIRKRTSHITIKLVEL